MFFFFFFFFVNMSSLFFFFNVFFLFDKLSSVIGLLTLWVFMILYVLCVKYNYIGGFIFKYKIFNFFLFFFLVAAITVNEMLGFYIFFEVSLIPLVYIILGWGYQVERIQASFYLFFYTMVGSLPMLFVFLSVYNFFSLDWPSLSFLVKHLVFDSFFFTLFLSLAFFIKLPLYGVHLWLPKAHVEAPMAGSMILAAVLLKLSLYGFYRFIVSMVFNFYFFWFLLNFLLWGSLLSSLICLRQTDLKSLIAYSSVGHMGVMMAGLFLFTDLSLKGSIFILMVHGFCSSSLFYLVNFHYERSFSRQVFNNRGQLTFFIFLILFWFLFLVVNFSAPPFLSLVGEIIIFISCAFSHYFLMVVLGLTSFIVALFCVYLYSVLGHGVVSKFNFVQLENDLNFLALSYHFIPCVGLVLVLDFLWF